MYRINQFSFPYEAAQHAMEWHTRCYALNLPGLKLNIDELSSTIRQRLSHIRFHIKADPRGRLEISLGCWESTTPEMEKQAWQEIEQALRDMENEIIAARRIQAIQRLFTEKETE